MPISFPLCDQFIHHSSQSKPLLQARHYFSSFYHCSFRTSGKLDDLMDLGLRDWNMKHKPWPEITLLYDGWCPGKRGCQDRLGKASQKSPTTALMGDLNLGLSQISFYFTSRFPFPNIKSSRAHNKWMRSLLLTTDGLHYFLASCVYSKHGCHLFR